MHDRPIVSRSEARAKGLKYFYTGKPCKHNHRCDRYTSNNVCKECGATAVSDPNKSRRDRELLRAEFKRPIAHRSVLSGREITKILEAFAQKGSHEYAAKSVGLTPIELIARRATHPELNRGLVTLEQRYAEGALKPSSLSDFQWTPEVRGKFIDTYVDTGDIASAREAVGATPSLYEKEIEANPEFSSEVREAEPKARKHLEERAIQLALAGNDKLLALVLKAKNSDYKDSVRFDVSHTVRLSDTELTSRIQQYQQRLGIVIDAEFTEGTGRVPTLIGRAGQETEEEQTDVDVPGDGSVSAESLS